MKSDTDPIQKILPLLLRGEHEEAVSLLRKERETFQKKLDEIDDLLAHAEGKPKRKLILKKKKRSKKKKSSRGSLSMSEKRRRRETVLKVANEVGDSNRTFTTDDVREAVEKKGLDLGVPSSRMNTTIGNIIKHFGDNFEQLSPGRFRMITIEIPFNTR